MIVVHEVRSLPVEACAKERGRNVVVLVRAGLPEDRRAELLAELLTSAELAELRGV